jgi:hypothetical protein
MECPSGGEFFRDARRRVFSAALAQAARSVSGESTFISKRAMKWHVIPEVTHGTETIFVSLYDQLGSV